MKFRNRKNTLKDRIKKEMAKRRLIIRSNKSTLDKLSELDSRIMLETMKSLNNDSNVDRVANDITPSSVNQPQEFFEQLESNSRANLPLSDECEILTRIYLGQIKIDQIKDSCVEEWNKELLTIAYYEKNNQKTGISYIKELKKKYKGDYEKTKKLNILFSKFSSSNKTKVFHAGLYEKYLGVRIDSDRVIEFTIENTKKKENFEIVKESNINEVKPEVKKEIKKVEKPVTNYVGSKGSTTNRYTSAGSNIKVTDNNSNNQVAERILSINDVFEDEIMALRMYIYALMMEEETRRIAVQAWDKLEILMDRPITTKASLERLLKVLKRLEELNYLKIDKEKVKKYCK